VNLVHLAILDLFKDFFIYFQAIDDWEVYYDKEVFVVYDLLVEVDRRSGFEFEINVPLDLHSYFPFYCILISYTHCHLSVVCVQNKLNSS